MNSLSVTVALVLLVGAWAQINELYPNCDSAEAEEAALVAQDYLNSQHNHGYKYALNRIEKIKIRTKPDGDNIYLLELDLLETDCHVLDPTPLANCTVRPKILTAIEGDCDVALKKVDGVLTVTGFRCKTDESREDICLGCYTLLPLNHTAALDLVHASLVTVNNKTENVTYTLLEVGRMMSQVVSASQQYKVEYVVGEANCTNGTCVPLQDAMAGRGICTAKGLNAVHTVDCKMFPTSMPVVDANNTIPLPPVVHVHTSSLSHKHGFKHHKLTAFHDPSSHLSAESESSEAVPVATAGPDAATAKPDDSVSASDASTSAEVPVPVVKRDVPVPQVDPIPAMPVCPGRVRFF